MLASMSRFLEHKEKTGETQGADAAKKASPIAWQNVNLHGRYEFHKQPDPMNVDAIIREMTEMRADRKAALAA